MKDHSSLSKGLFKINFMDHMTFAAPDLTKLSDRFLSNNGIVRGSPIGKKAGLSRTNDCGEDGFDYVNNNLGNQFVNGVTESNGSEVSESTFP